MTELKTPAIKKSIDTSFFEIQKLKLVVPKSGEAKEEGKSYRFSTLKDIMDTLSEPLVAQQLVISHAVEMQNEKPVFITYVKHIPSDKKVFSSVPIVATLPMNVGASITYYKRYNISALFNLVTEEEAPVLDEVKTDVAPLEIQSDAYQSALEKLNNADTKEAKDFLKDAIKKSKKLTDEEKNDLLSR